MQSALNVIATLMNLFQSPNYKHDTDFLCFLNGHMELMEYRPNAFYLRLEKSVYIKRVSVFQEVGVIEEV